MSDIFVEPLVSVVIPTYGRALFLPKAINSVLSQSYKNFEIVVVNDNGKDSVAFMQTEEVLKNYRNNISIKIVSEGVNLGGSEARNKGINNSNGDYITFLDDDDYYYEDKLKKQIKHILDNNLDVSICNMDFFRKNQLFKNDRNGLARIGEIHDFILTGNAYTPMILCKKSVLLEVDGFTVSPRFQDHILMIKILGKGFKVGIINESLFVHVQHDGERITYSKKTREAFLIKRRIEERYVSKFKEKNKKKYIFSCLLDDYIYFNDKKFNLIIFLKLMRYCDSLSDFRRSIITSFKKMIKQY